MNTSHAGTRSRAFKMSSTEGDEAPQAENRPGAIDPAFIVGMIEKPTSPCSGPGSANSRSGEPEGQDRHFGVEHVAVGDVDGAERDGRDLR